ncbi:MAG: hypothetical protein ACYCXF_02865 [Thermoleophilia bacterium]
MKIFAKITLLATGSLFMLLILASVVYGAAPQSDPINVNVTVDDYITITHPTDVTLSNIAGQGGSSVGNVTWKVSTNSIHGYELKIAAASSPALSKGTDSFADYAGLGAWSIPATDSAFGFSVNNTTNYKGLTGATAIQINSHAFPVIDDSTLVNFKAEVGASHLQPSGSYAAHLTVTAVTLP